MSLSLNWYANYLAKLPPDWEKVRVDQLGSMSGGGTPSREQPAYWNGSIPWVTPAEITSLNGTRLYETREFITHAGLASSSAELLPRGSILVTTRATIGAVAVADLPVATNQGFKSIAPNESTDSSFYCHLFRYIRPELIRLSSGSTFTELSRRDFAAIRIPRPALPEQRRIAELIDAADSVIEQSEALIIKLRQQRDGLRNDILLHGLNDIGQLRNPATDSTEFAESPLGWLPAVWETPTFEDITPSTAPICYGIVQPGPHVNFGIPTIAIHDLAGNYSEGVHQVDPTIEARYTRSRIRPGDVLLSVKGTTGRVGIVPPHFTGNISRDVARIRPSDRVLPQFLRQLLMAPATQQRLERAVVGTTRSEISIGVLKLLVVPVPPKPEQFAIAERLDAQDTRIQTEEDVLAKLRLKKAGLVHDLLTGAVRVSTTPL